MGLSDRMVDGEWGCQTECGRGTGLSDPAVAARGYRTGTMIIGTRTVTATGLGEDGIGQNVPESHLTETLEMIRRTKMFII